MCGVAEVVKYSCSANTSFTVEEERVGWLMIYLQLSKERKN